MKMLKRFRQSDIGILLRREYWRRRGKKELKKYDDYTLICNKYRRLGRELNLKNPTRFTEKLQWLKLFYRNDLMPICSNKYTLREYAAGLGYEGLMNELIGVYSSVDDLDISALPDRFVIKAAHGSGWNLIVRDKAEINWRIWKKIMKSWLRQNLYWFGREWNYAEQKPQLVVEKYLEDDSGELRDFKVFCMNGTPKFIQIDENRFTNHKRVYIDCEGNRLAIEDSQTKKEQERYPFGDTQREMIRIAQDLSKPFPFVRVDFYCCDQKIYLGEMTFFGGSGFYSFDPDEWDYTVGSWLELPEPNHNLELYQKIEEGTDE